jgi:hypothetical protein
MSDVSAVSWPAQGGYVPDRPAYLPYILDFTNTGNLDLDLQRHQANGRLKFAQSLFVDNSQNPSTLTFFFRGTGQTLVIQPYMQGDFPIKISTGVIRFTAVTTAGVKIQVIFSNLKAEGVPWGPVPGANVVPALTNSPVQFTPLSTVADNVLVAGVAGKVISVYRLILSFAAAANIQFWNGASAGAVDFTGFQYMFAGGFYDPPVSGIPLFVCAAGNSLVLTSSAAANMGGMIGVTQQ